MKHPSLGILLVGVDLPGLLEGTLTHKLLVGLRLKKKKKRGSED